MEAFTIFLPIAGVEFNWLILLLIGFSVGLMGGFFGIGGGPILTPALNIFGFPMAVAIGTGMLNVYGQSLVGFRKHAKLGNVQFRLGVIVGAAMLVGVELGKRMVMGLERYHLEGSTVRIVYLVLLSGLTARFLHDYRAARRRGDHRRDDAEIDPAGAEQAPPKPGIAPALAIGLGVGTLSGFLGVGGGFLLVPAFLYLLKLSTRAAVGTSVLCCVVSGAYGGIAYAAQGRMDLIAVLPMLVGASFGAQIGATAVQYARSHGLRLLYGIMLMMAAGGLALKQLDEMMPAMNFALAAQGMVLATALFISLVILAQLVRGVRAAQRNPSDSP
jgi:uncharacterized protein